VRVTHKDPICRGAAYRNTTVVVKT